MSVLRPFFVCFVSVHRLAKTERKWNENVSMTPTVHLQCTCTYMYMYHIYFDPDYIVCVSVLLFYVHCKCFCLPPCFPSLSFYSSSFDLNTSFFPSSCLYVQCEGAIGYTAFVQVHICVQRPIHVSTAITRLSWYRLMKPVKERSEHELVEVRREERRRRENS